MGNTPSNFSPIDNKSKVGVILGVLAVHAVVAVGLSKLPPLELKKPEPPKPIEITFIQPEIVEPEPLPPEPTPAPPIPTPSKPKPRPTPPKPVEPPPPPPKKVVEKVEPKKVEPKKIEKPVTPPKEIVKVEKTVNNKPNQWEIEQQKQREREKEQERERQREQERERQREQERERQREQERERQREQERERQREQERERQREQERERQREQERERQREQERERQREQEREQNNTPVHFSESQARWKRQPRIAIKQEYADENLRVVFRLTVNKQGKIDNIAVSKSSGNSKFDSEMRKALSSARLHPFEQNGVPVVGIVNVSVP